MFNKFVSKFAIILCLAIFTLSGCAPKQHIQNLKGTPEENKKINRASSHEAFVPIAIACAGLAIAFVAGAAGYSHDQPSGSTTVQ